MKDENTKPESKEAAGLELTEVSAIETDSTALEAKQESINESEKEHIDKEEKDEYSDDFSFEEDKEEEQFDDEGELSEYVTNDVSVDGAGHASIVGSTINIGVDSQDDTTTACPSCHNQIDANKYGTIVCEKCGFKIYRRNLKLAITQFKTIQDEEKEKQLLDVIARINNNMIRRRYNDSFKYCLEAEELAPREPTTWEYYTLIDFYREVSRPKEQKKDIQEILKYVRDNIRICEANDVEEEKIEEIKGEIGIYIFNYAKSQIGQYYSRSKKRRGYWSKVGRRETIKSLRLFEACYRLTNDPFYLEGYVEELTKPYKWIVKQFSGLLINLPACGRRYNAVFLREKMIKKIEKLAPNYIPPEPAKERLTIKLQDIPVEEKVENTGISNISFEN